MRHPSFVVSRFARPAEVRRYASSTIESMATDSLKLFDKILADQILALGREPLSAFGDEEIHLDYWGCYAKVFDGHPEGSISSLSYSPEHEEETFLLLRPDHVDQIIKSLYDHIDDLSVMDKEQIEKLERWRDFCAANPSHMVAYLFDF